MRTCPKCGRTFKRQEQSHYCGKAPETVDEYIAAQPEEVRDVGLYPGPEAVRELSSLCKLMNLCNNKKFLSRGKYFGKRWRYFPFCVENFI